MSAGCTNKPLFTNNFAIAKRIIQCVTLFTACYTVPSGKKKRNYDVGRLANVINIINFGNTWICIICICVRQRSIAAAKKPCP